MGLSRNKVAVPEGAAGSPPFYGDSGRGFSRPVSPPGRMVRRRWGCWCGRDRWLSCGMGMLLGSRIATGPSGLARFAIPGPVRPPGGVRGFGFRSWWWFENWRVDASKKDSFLVYCFFGRTSSCRGFVLCSDRFVIISAKICCPVFAGFVAGGRVVAREGRMVDALADSTDEGRVRLR